MSKIFCHVSQVSWSQPTLPHQLQSQPLLSESTNIYCHWCSLLGSLPPSLGPLPASCCPGPRAVHSPSDKRKDTTTKRQENHWQLWSLCSLYQSASTPLPCYSPSACPAPRGVLVVSGVFVLCNGRRDGPVWTTWTSSLSTEPVYLHTLFLKLVLGFWCHQVRFGLAFHFY